MLFRMMSILAFALIVGVVYAGEPGEVTAEWTPEEVEQCRRSSSVGPADGGGLTLIDRDLIRYEVGATVHAAYRHLVAERVTDRTWIRKDFVLEQTACHGAVLLINHSGDARRLEVLFNGEKLPFEVVHRRARGYSGVYPEDAFPEDHDLHHLNGQPFKSWWRGGWQEVEVPPELLREGKNTVIIRGTSDQPVRFWIERSVYPNRSAVSRDGGQTWDYERLSTNQNLNGEYVIRLLLRRHPESGWIESEPVDLWPSVGETDVRLPSRLTSLRMDAAGPDAPEGPELNALVRVGPTPTYEPETWTAWADPADIEGGDYRYAQWRVELAPSTDRMNAHTLTGVALTGVTEPAIEPPDGLRVTGSEVDQPEIIRPSHVFVHARKTARLDLLREQAELDEVVEGHEPGLQQAQRISQWIRSLRAGNNSGGELDYFPSWDGLLFWNFARPGDIGRMCTTRCAFFAQCATALGYPARPIIWSHAIAEAWIDDLGGWVAFDQSGGHYYEVNGKPASVLQVAKARGNPDLEVRRVWREDRKSDPRPDSNLAWYGRFFVPMRSNFLESDEPQEPAHGKYSFKYDGHLRWLHPDREPLPWFRFTTSRDGDIDFTCNTVNLTLALTAEPGELNVQLEHDMPNLERFEARRNGGEWEPVEGSFVWAVRAGENTLEVRAVNAFGRAGRVARATVTAAE